MQYQNPKGTRDFYPEEKEVRTVLFNKFRALAKRYNYGEIETPAFEYLDFLTEKSGEAIKQEIFVFEKRSTEQFALRFDLTVPAARLFLQKQKELPKPVKWFYVDKMWRYEAPQKGRLREFYQMGVELFGSGKPEADAEVITLAIDFLLELGLKEGQFVVRINNRKLLEGLLQGLKIKQIPETIRVIDKSKKLSEQECDEELKKLKLTADQLKSIKSLLNIKDPREIETLTFLTEEAKQGLQEVIMVIKALKLFEKEQYTQFDLATARGLEYYTGCVFECFDVKGAFRSIFAGGRYDKMVGNFGGEPTPATGFAMGDATLQILLEENNLWSAPKRELDYCIIVIGEKAKEKAFELCQNLRKKGSVEIDMMGRSIKNQLDYANRCGAKKAIFIGDEEIKSGKATVKDLATRKEEKIAFEEL